MIFGKRGDAVNCPPGTSTFMGTCAGCSLTTAVNGHVSPDGFEKLSFFIWEQRTRDLVATFCRDVYRWKTILVQVFQVKFMAKL